MAREGTFGVADVHLDGMAGLGRQTTMRHAFLALIACAFAFGSGSAAQAQTADELAKQLANPIASLTSVPLQGNFDFGAGADGEGNGFTLNVQPVVPISLNDNWVLISRTIVPLAYRDYAAAPDSHISGIGDITQSFNFFRPSEASMA